MDEQEILQRAQRIAARQQNNIRIGQINIKAADVDSLNASITLLTAKGKGIEAARTAKMATFKDNTDQDSKDLADNVDQIARIQDEIKLRAAPVDSESVNVKS